MENLHCNRSDRYGKRDPLRGSTGGAIHRTGGPAVVGIDPDFDKLPAELRDPAARSGRASSQLDAIFQYCVAVLGAVAPVAAPSSSSPRTSNATTARASTPTIRSSTRPAR